MSSNTDLIFFRIYQILIPILICCLYVIFLLRILSWRVNYNEEGIFDRTWAQLGIQLDESHSNIYSLGYSILLVIIFLGFIGLVTLMILFAFYMGWHQFLGYYFYLPSAIVMLIVTPAFIRDIGSVSTWLAIDIISLAIFTWNFFALGMMAIFGLYASAPLVVQQMYLIHNSAMLTLLIIIALPGWAPWILLSLLVLWDCFAVMAPFGPLNIIINLAEREGIVDMPGLIYATEASSRRNSSSSKHTCSPSQSSQQDISTVDSTSDKFSGTVDTEETDKLAALMDIKDMMRKAEIGQDEVQSAKHDLSDQDRSLEERGINMGLGDFVFFGLIVGLTCKEREEKDFYMTASVIDAVLVGVIATLVILVMIRRAIPALPISITLGILVAPISSRFAAQIMNRFASEQIFV